MLHFHPNRRKKTGSAPLAPPLKMAVSAPPRKKPNLMYVWQAFYEYFGASDLSMKLSS